MCTGTGYVVRRSALNEIGGWPLAETGEDYMCSALLSDAGWKIAFVRENLQFGLAPGSLLGLLKQRMRWVRLHTPFWSSNIVSCADFRQTDAGVEVHQQFGYYLPGSKTTAKMTWSQRLVNMLYMLRDYAPVTNVLALALLPIALYPTQADDLVLEQANSLWLRRTFLIAYIAYKVNHYNVYSQIGLSRVLNFQSNEIWAAPCTSGKKSGSHQSKLRDIGSLTRSQTWPSVASCPYYPPNSTLRPSSSAAPSPPPQTSALTSGADPFPSASSASIWSCMRCTSSTPPYPCSSVSTCTESAATPRLSYRRSLVLR